MLALSERLRTTFCYVFVLMFSANHFTFFSQLGNGEIQ
ncbi:hypothetical protein MTBSS4_890002 [Magnetospirillum sp. SS-4]|nr:hypothetical protein MTBSS4_890002 [Magnetospirillum sp. SS-4]